VVDLEKLTSILNNLRSCLEKLAILASRPELVFVQDFTNVESAKHLLQVCIECCLDIAHHIIADEGFRTPTSYYDTFVVLSENEVLPDDFLPTLRQMVSFRNRLVHLYWDVDDATVYRILQERLDDFETYVDHILHFVTEQK
jgi:uncharacterized protein YutE (UPF0331/DUF86 family)